MRWAPIFWLWISCAIFASTIVEAKREKRDLLTIKKFLISKFFGNGRRKCAGKSPTSRPFKSHEIFLVPNRQNFVIEKVPKPTKLTVVKATRQYDENFFLSSIRQFLNSEMFKETSEAVREIITGVLNAEETNIVVNDKLPQVGKYIPGDAFTVNQKLPAIVSDRPIFEYRRPHISTYLPSMIGFANPIISMPRIYSYEQIKGDTVEKFTLDKNSDVTVTHTRQPPRPPYVEDRIKEVILAIPPATPSFYSDILNRQTATSSYKNQEKPDSDSTEKLQRSYNNSPNQMLQQYLDQLHRSSAVTDSIPLLEHKTPLKPTRNLNQYVYIPPEYTQESSTKLSNIGLIPIDKTNVPTRYTYKQVTNNGVIQFGDTWNENSDEKSENNVVSKDITTYANEPIVVAPIDNPSANSLRGDIPQIS